MSFVPSSRRVRGLLSALLSLASASSWAVTTDYWMPYTASQPDNFTSRGLWLVSSADGFKQKKTVLDATVGISHLHVNEIATWTGDALADRRPRSMVFLRDGHWYTGNLQLGSPVQLRRLSTQTAAKVCTSVIQPFDIQAPENNPLLYSLPGNDGVCHSSDDVYRRVALSAGPDAVPQAVPFAFQVPMFGPTRQVEGLLAQMGANIDWYSPDLQQHHRVASDVAAWYLVGRTPQGDQIMLTDGVFRRVSPDGATVQKLGGFSSEESFHDVQSDDTAAYFEEQYHTADNRLRHRLVRLAFDGSGRSVIGVGNAEWFTPRALTENRVVVETGGSGTAARSLIAFRKNGSKDQDPARIVKVDSQTLVNVQSTSGDRVYLTTDDFHTPHAMVVKDNGILVEDFGPGSLFQLGVVASTFPLSAYDAAMSYHAMTHLRLTTTGSALDPKVTLYSYRVADDTRLPLLARRASTMPYLYLGATSSRALGVMTYADNTDVFAVDMDTGEFRRVTSTVDLDEATQDEYSYDFR